MKTEFHFIIAVVRSKKGVEFIVAHFGEIRFGVVVEQIVFFFLGQFFGTFLHETGQGFV